MKTMRFIIVSLLALFSLLYISSCQNNSSSIDDDYENINYSTNIESIMEYFSGINDIEKVYFKSKSLNNNDRGIGPTSATIVGFICISENEKQSIMNKYDFAESDPGFLNGISAEVTGFDNFDWRSSYTFTNDVTKGNLVGDLYFDVNNGVIYVDAQTN